jgi:hypothetical protein
MNDKAVRQWTCNKLASVGYHALLEVESRAEWEFALPSPMLRVVFGN